MPNKVPLLNHHLLLLQVFVVKVFVGGRRKYLIWFLTLVGQCWSLILFFQLLFIYKKIDWNSMIFLGLKFFPWLLNKCVGIIYTLLTIFGTKNSLPWHFTNTEEIFCLKSWLLCNYFFIFCFERNCQSISIISLILFQKWSQFLSQCHKSLK